MANTSDYTAQILVARPSAVEVMGHKLHFRQAPDGPLTDELEAKAARGWSADELADWLAEALDDPEIVVSLEICRDLEGWSVTACVGRVVEVV